jgi:hypothetical protein
MLRRRRCSDWRARFFADLMLAKVELRNAVLGLEKDANYAGDSAVRQLNARAGGSLSWPGQGPAARMPGFCRAGLSTWRRPLSNYAPRQAGPGAFFPLSTR